jgi:hypothetical protein
VQLGGIEHQECGLRRFFIGAAIAILVGLLTSTSRATTWLNPSRTLTADEKLELAVSESDAVGFGFVVGVHDTIVDVVGGTGIPARSLTLRPTEWLMGEAGGQALEVGLAAGDNSPLFSDLLTTRGLDSRTALFFLEKHGLGWTLRAYPDPPPLQLTEPPELGQTRERVLRAIARESPDSLLRRADVVVVGRREADSSCSSGTRECAPVSVSRVLVGTNVPPSIRVASVMLGHMGSGDALYLLRASTDGVYETVGFRNGSLPVHAGIVDRWGISVDKVRQKAQAVRTASRRGP